MSTYPSPGQHGWRPKKEGMKRRWQLFLFDSLGTGRRNAGVGEDEGKNKGRRSAVARKTNDGQLGF